MSRLVLLCLISLLGLPRIGGATSFVEVPFEETVSDAPIVVRGKVGGKRADWGRGSDGRDRIYTYFDLTIQERLKGDPGRQDQILMRELGGEVGGVGMQVSGTAQFQEGEDVVVFLSPPVEDSKGRTSFDIRGMMMGKYSVIKDQNGQEILEGAGLDSLEHPLERDLRHKLEAQGDTKPRAKWSLTKLRELIRTQAQGGAVAAQVPALSEEAGNTAPAQARNQPEAPRLQAPPSEEEPLPVPAEAVEPNRKAWILAFGIVLGSLLYLVRRLGRR
jgi:hypothetical protein